MGKQEGFRIFNGIQIVYQNKKCDSRRSAMGIIICVWKENMIENLKSRSLSYTIVGEYLLDLKEEYSRVKKSRIGE